MAASPLVLLLAGVLLIVLTASVALHIIGWVLVALAVAALLGYSYPHYHGRRPPP